MRTFIYFCVTHTPKRSGSKQSFARILWARSWGGSALPHGVWTVPLHMGRVSPAVSRLAGPLLVVAGLPPWHHVQ